MLRLKKGNIVRRIKVRANIKAAYKEIVFS